MDIFWFALGGILGYLIGHFTVTKEVTPDEEKCDFLKAQLEKDIVYYKKLTRNLVEENKELRKNV